MKKEKIILLLLIVIICKIMIFAQNNDRPAERCRDVFSRIQKSYPIDSVAIEQFKDNYTFVNMRNNQISLLLRKNYIELIQYFNSENGKNCFCQSRIIVVSPDYTLLDTHVPLSRNK